MTQRRPTSFDIAAIAGVSQPTVSRALSGNPSMGLLVFMVLVQGALGYGVTSVFGAIPAEIFEGPSYGSIFGTLMVAAIGGGAVGPWVAGLIHDRTGSYEGAFWVATGAVAVSIVAIWVASPRRVRSVAGRAALTQARAR